MPRHKRKTTTEQLNIRLSEAALKAWRESLDRARETEPDLTAREYFERQFLKKESESSLT